MMTQQERESAAIAIRILQELLEKDEQEKKESEKGQELPDIIPEMISIASVQERTGLSRNAVLMILGTNPGVYIKNGKKCIVNWPKFVRALNEGRAAG